MVGIDRDACRAPRVDRHAVERDRSVEAGGEPLGGLEGARLVADTTEDDGELVAPDPCDGGRVVHDDRQPARHLFQKQVAVVVPERRVHLLEAIDVEDDHCDS